ncbi:hypothetical protein L1049_019091 [Liquidambar formosana]|uniref:Pectinesterase inhibitor domain-containing protein n=1 Tax=Liquidambar formosana TaxID=63359 RepID=A0AAP0RBY6_LIQFO
MRPSFPFLALSLFLFPVFTFHLTTGTNLINETCRNSSQNDPNVNYNFCVASLKAAPDSHCASLRHLGLISIRLIRYNATNTRCYIKELLKNTKLDPYVKQCLTDCLDLYSDAIPTLKEAMLDYRAKNFTDANMEISAAMDASTTCEDGFVQEDGVVSPLTKRNNDTFQLSAIALSIINMVH